MLRVLRLRETFLVEFTMLFFLYVREWLLKHTNYTSQPKKEHSTMPKYIKSNGPFSNEVNHNISKNLKMLKKLRHQSDYYLEIPPLYSYEYSNWIFRDVSHAFILANEIITTLENN